MSKEKKSSRENKKAPSVNGNKKQSDWQSGKNSVCAVLPVKKK